MSRKSPAADQTLLPLVSQDLPEAAESHGVFSVGYLRRHLAASSDFPKIDEAKPIYEAIAELWHKQGVGLRNQNEAFTRNAFIDPVLKLLGWQFVPENSMPGAFATRKRPDYCLFSNDDNYSAGIRAEGQDLFRLSASVLEAKQCGHPLDRVSRKETPGWFPSQQIQDYLNHAKDESGRRFFDWAILTNAKEWRLYTERSAVDAYFAFHLISDDAICDFDEFLHFVALFRASAFSRDKRGKCFLDEIQEQSLRLQGELEYNLRKRIFDVLEDLGNGFHDHTENHLGSANYAAIYETSLIFLYRLLFVLYAESRDLLPVKSRGEGANRRYREDFSLAQIVEQLRDKSKFDSNDFHDLYDRLLRLFHLINGSNPKQNEACRVTRYNGGLFNPELHPNIEGWRIGDRSLANILRQLIFTQPPSRGAQRQLQISTDETIDYSTLEVRQLGDIYEGLLGGQLALVNNRLQLQNENGENHRHGTFYTPDWVVRYLLRETVQPLLDEIEASPEVQSAIAAKSEEKRRDNSFAYGVLRLNLVDPAMGSGHFLVRATEWLAEHILYHPTTRTMTMQVVTTGAQKITREQITARGLIPVSSGISQEQAEMAYWRRRVVEACIYGVDVNPLAVELAKLSLWLTCIAVDEPLNFLDHHLRHGNSLLFVHLRELRHGPIRLPQDETEPFDLGNRLTSALSAIIRETLAIEAVASTEMEVVKDKERRWKEVRHKIEPFSGIADLWLAALDGLPVNDLDYRTLARLQVTPDELSAEELATAKKLARSIDADLQTRKSALRPFHWELEFPDVFYAEGGSQLPAEKRGFDAVLGNPPYISTHTSTGQDWRQALSLRTGWLEDLYLHFTQLGFDILRPRGGFGFIVSDTFFTLASKERMRLLLQGNQLTHLGQCDPFNATVDAAIFVARKGPRLLIPKC
jgi:type I restriction-modification system DNA methylase subunit